MDKQQLAKDILNKYKIGGYVPPSKQPVNLKDRFAEIDALSSAEDKKIQAEGAKANEFLGKSTLSQIFSKETARELLPKTGESAKDILIDTPIKVGKSVATAPATILTGGEYTAKGTYQDEAKGTASDIIEGKKPLISALTPFLTVPLDVTGTVGLGVGAKNAVKASAPLVSQQLAKRQATKIAAETANAEKIVGQIIQGTPDDIVSAKKALSSIDVKDIKTYEDLSSTLENRIKTVSEALDNTLEQTPTYNNLLKIGDMDKAIKVGNQTVRNNYVDEALTQLRDFYTKTNNIERKTVIEQMIQKGNTEGLSVKELNDIAKLHGQDLNAFNASGELASGLSKQAAENTRKGVKSTAREIFGGDAYAQADGELTNLLNTKKLIDDVATKVNTLKQRVDERGLGEKVGRLVFQVADKFTGGGLKGFVQSFIPRGQGLKVMNALDLESALQKNLKAIDKALNQKTEKGMIESLNAILSDVKNTPNKQGGFVKVGQDSEAFLKSQPTKNIASNTSIPKTVAKSNQIIKDLESFDALPVKTNKGFAYGDTDANFRLSQLKDKMQTKNLTKAELSEAESLLKQVGGSSDVPKVKATEDPLYEFKTFKGAFKDEFKGKTEVMEAINDIGGIKNVKRDLVDIDDLKPTEIFDRNNTGVQRALKEIQAGVNTPLIVDEGLNIIDGNHRYVAQKMSGKMNISVVRPKSSLKVKGENPTNLISEAKKYKSAEEFVKAQGTPVYHGSPSADMIEKEGFKLGKVESLANAYGKGVYLTDSKNLASAYGGKDGKGIVKVYLPKDVKLYKANANKDAYRLDINKLKEKGFDGVEVDLMSGKKQITIFDPIRTSTKSQLKDIWEKANKK